MKNEQKIIILEKKDAIRTAIRALYQHRKRYLAEIRARTKRVESALATLDSIDWSDEQIDLGAESYRLSPEQERLIFDPTHDL